MFDNPTGKVGLFKPSFKNALLQPANRKSNVNNRMFLVQFCINEEVGANFLELIT